MLRETTHQGRAAFNSSQVNGLYQELPLNEEQLPRSNALASYNHYDYGFRIYNPRIAKFLSVDPLTKEYPWYTPYQFAGNMPINAIDLDGLEPQQATSNQNMIGLQSSISAQKYNDIVNTAYRQTCHDNYIIKNEKTGVHEFDLNRARRVINSTVNNEGYEAAALQFKEMYSNYQAALEKYDKFYFNGQIQKAKDEEAKKYKATQRQRQLERRIRDYQKAVKDGRVDAYVDMFIGGVGMIGSSLFLETPLGWISGGLSADLAVGAYLKLQAINDECLILIRFINL